MDEARARAEEHMAAWIDAGSQTQFTYGGVAVTLEIPPWINKNDCYCFQVASAFLDSKALELESERLYFFYNLPVLVDIGGFTIRDPWTAQKFHLVDQISRHRG